MVLEVEVVTQLEILVVLTLLLYLHHRFPHTVIQPIITHTTQVYPILVTVIVFQFQILVTLTIRQLQERNSFQAMVVLTFLMVVLVDIQVLISI